ncbi:MAG: long-chain-fatty-acid--CoA ligase [Bryobacteraceae bacterium]|nr:long-chain-fatty-acid--CoA ligase [Bryobacteraceae bacterium]
MLGRVSYEDLNPGTFLERSGSVYANRTGVIYRDRSYAYAEFRRRAQRLGAALRKAGLGKGDRVAVMSPNTPAMLECCFGPMQIGAILVAINIRLAAREIGYIVNHSGAKAVLFDSEFAPVVRGFRADAKGVETWVQIVDEAPKAEDIEGPDYETFLSEAGDGEAPAEVLDERETVTLNYTSGTTGLPKGVEYHARGAYLNALGEALEVGLNPRSVYLYTVPMFHCNGWCFPWAATAAGATHVCLRKVVPEEIFRLIRERGVTHLCCAPTVLISLYSSPHAKGQDLSGVTIVTAGAPPAPQVIRTMEQMGAHVYHVYGLTETYGPHTICAEQAEWDGLPVEERARRKARQGVPYIIAGTNLRVVDEQMNDVPSDGRTPGEVVMRGNNVMTGYYNDPEATEKAFRGGWFHSGDIGVRHPDGYIELMDRSKDIIISGGENISSQEVEKLIMEHPAVLEVAVVAVPDDKWGETPKAFVVKKPGAEVTAEEIIEFTRRHIAHFKCPKHVEFSELPKTATGKIQKFRLREKEWRGYEKRIH